ncbi:unnamed protein product [Rotaria magnacalcarata]|uniref:Uncharacterized protein n=1 Tax=Rotaria magnacalcarata TaxID=392030 RepID=A0A820Q7B0_9BILA|nr:unnamed protein product [Rotaria magnacalcarata]
MFANGADCQPPWPAVDSAKFYPVEQSIQQNQLISFDFIGSSLISKPINNTWILEYASGITDNINHLPCDCEQVFLCLKPLGFYSYSSLNTQTNAIPYQLLPTIHLTCQLLDFGYSTLDGFFSESCVQMLIDQRLCGYENIYLPINLSNITALNPNDFII